MGRWLHSGSSNMAVLEVPLFSGFRADIESLEQVRGWDGSAGLGCGSLTGRGSLRGHWTSGHRWKDPIKTGKGEEEISLVKKSLKGVNRRSEQAEQTQAGQAKVFLSQCTVINWDPLEKLKCKCALTGAVYGCLVGCVISNIWIPFLWRLCVLEFFALFFFFSPSLWENIAFPAAKLRWTECASCPASPLGQMNCNLELCFMFVEALHSSQPITFCGTLHLLVGWMVQRFFFLRTV